MTQVLSALTLVNCLCDPHLCKIHSLNLHAVFWGGGGWGGGGGGGGSEGAVGVGEGGGGGGGGAALCSC